MKPRWTRRGQGEISALELRCGMAKIANLYDMRNFIILIVALVALCGCTRKIYVPVENTAMRTDTVRHYLTSTDSVTVVERIYESDTRYDSIAPILDSLNRVIGWDRYHFRESTKKDERELKQLQAQVDSLKAVKIDSVKVSVPYPVERELTRWEKVKMDAGGIAIGAGTALLVAVIALLIWLIKIKRRK